MTKCEEFVAFIDELIAKNDVEVPERAAEYLEALRNSAASDSKGRELFTENGKLILQYLQTCVGMLKAKDIAEALNISSRTVSGAMRKLVADGYVEKNGTNPVVYNITDKGNEINFENVD